MGTKTLLRLVIVLAVFGVIALALHFFGSGGRVSQVVPSTTKAKVFSDFPLNDVARIAIEGPEGSLGLRKGEADWEIEERDGYPADAADIANLLRDVWDLSIAQPVAVGRAQYGRLGLLGPDEGGGEDETATLLRFEDAEGAALATLWLGRVHERSEGRPDPFGGGMATTEAGRYVKTGESNAVFLVGETFRSVRLDPSDWLDKSFFRVEGLVSIEIDTGDAESDWKLTRPTSSDDFDLAEAAGDEELDPTKVASMKGAFSSPQIEDVLVGEAAEKHPVGAATFRIETADGFRYEIAIGEKNDLNELPLTVSVSAEFPEEREVGEEESDEEKERLDEEFAANLERLNEKLEREQRLEGHVFKVRSFIIDPLLKDRSELLAEKAEAEEPETEEIAPGVSLPGLPAPSPAEAPEPATAPEPEPAPEPEAAPAPEAEAAPAPAKGKGKGKGKGKAPEEPEPEEPKPEEPKPEEPKPEEPKPEEPKPEEPEPEASEPETEEPSA